MMMIELIIKLPIKISNNAAANANGHAQNINSDEEFVLLHAAKSDEEIVFDHIT